MIFTHSSHARRRQALALVAALTAVVTFAPRLHAQPVEEDRTFRMAQGYEQSGDLPSAARTYAELYSIDPSSKVYFEGVERTYRALLRYADLLPIVEERLKRYPKDFDLRVSHADLLNRTHQPEAASREWNAAIELQPSTQVTYAIVAQSQANNHLFDKSIDTYLRGRIALDDRSLFSTQLAPLYAMVGRFGEATGEYVRMLESNPQTLRYVMNGMGMFTTNPDAAKAAVDVVKLHVAQRPDFVPFLDLLSWLYTEQGDYQAAFDVAVRIDSARGGNGSTVFQFADRALREGRSEAAVTAYEYFLQHFDSGNPLHAPALVNYAHALEQQYRQRGTISRDDAEKLVDRYRDIAESESGNAAAAEAMFSEARLQADDLDEPEDAIETIEQLRTQYPRFPQAAQAVLLLGDLKVRVGSVDEAIGLYRSGAADTSGTNDKRSADQSRLRLARTYFQLGRFADAAAIFDRLAADAESDAANDALGYELLLDESRASDSIALTRYGAAQLQMLQHQWDEAAQSFDLVMRSDPSNTLAERALSGRAEAEERLGKFEQAVKTLLMVDDKYSSGSLADRSLMHAAELAEQQLNDRARAIELYTRLLTRYPQSPYVASARARIRQLRGDGRTPDARDEREDGGA